MSVGVKDFSFNKYIDYLFVQSLGENGNLGGKNALGNKSKYTRISKKI